MTRIKFIKTAARALATATFTTALLLAGAASARPAHAAGVLPKCLAITCTLPPRPPGPIVNVPPREAGGGSLSAIRQPANGVGNLIVADDRTNGRRGGSSSGSYHGTLTKHFGGYSRY